ncbi:MAG: hypothetical protein A2511_17570 [Deltaproteobacteria bacterium RIFOXYD12_FULL_50_9]|nr:MAG: hypothetical protein A2511_17570 [Deltaproteobacteria bacterium RIFOXYD12_FULL_50_9]
MIKEAISVINQMKADGIIGRYAIGGAIGATFYLEPVSTIDLDIFIAVEPQPGEFIISLQPVFDYLKAKNAVPEGEYILFAGWPIQFLVPNSPLVEEALTEAVQTDVDGEPAWVFRPEYLAAIALQLGRAKDKNRLLEFIEQKALDLERFLKIVQNHQLTNKWKQFEQQFLGADNL